MQKFALKNISPTLVLVIAFMACSDTSNNASDSENLPATDGTGFPLVVDEENHRIKYLVQGIDTECIVSSDTTSVFETVQEQEVVFEYEYKISGDSLYLTQMRNGEPYYDYQRIYLGNSSSIYGTWHAQDDVVRNGELDRVHAGYNVLSRAKMEISKNSIEISPERNPDWNLYKVETMERVFEHLLKKGNYYSFDGEDVFHSAQDRGAQYADGVVEISRTGYEAIFDVRGTQVVFSDVVIDEGRYLFGQEHFSIKVSANGKSCQYDFLSDDYLNDLCKAENIPYFRMSDEYEDGLIHVYRYNRDNAEEFGTCLNSLL